MPVVLGVPILSIFGPDIGRLLCVSFNLKEFDSTLLRGLPAEPVSAFNVSRFLGRVFGSIHRHASRAVDADWGSVSIIGVPSNDIHNCSYNKAHSHNGGRISIVF